MSEQNIFSGGDVARILGVCQSQIYYWVGHRHLRAERPKPRRVLITARNLREFLERGGALAHNLNPSPSWRPVVEAARASLLERWIDTASLAALLGCDSANIYYLRRYHLFPDPVLRRGYAPDYYHRAAVRQWLDAHPAYWTRQAKERL